MIFLSLSTALQLTLSILNPCGDVTIFCQTPNDPSCCVGKCCEFLNVYKDTTLPWPPIDPATITVSPPITNDIPRLIQTVSPAPQSVPLTLCTKGYVNCIIPPCTRSSCAAHPTAICTNDQCGGCNTIWTDRNGILFTEQQCLQPAPPTPSSTLHTIPQISSTLRTIPQIPITPSIITRSVPQISSQIQAVILPHVVGQCNEGYVSCDPVPCDTASCPAYPSAICTNNFCGRCSAIFSVLNNNGAILTEQQCQGSTTPIVIQPRPQIILPPFSGCNLGFVNCIVSPCSMESCPAHPTATCTDDYCGGCNTIWKDQNGDELTVEQCVVSETNPETLPQIDIKPEVKPLPTLPQIDPVPEPCPLSHFGYIECGPCTVGYVACVVAPCSIASCNAHPTATCTNNYCGGCHAIFRDENGVILSDLQCNEVIQPIVQPPIEPPPPIPTTTTTTTTAPTAVPTAGTTTAAPSVAPTTTTTTAAPTDVPTAATTTAAPSVSPTTTTSTPVDVALPQPETPKIISICTLGYVACDPTPCFTANCPGYPTATCTNDYCGACNAIFKDESGKELSSIQCQPHVDTTLKPETAAPIETEPAQPATTTTTETTLQAEHIPLPNDIPPVIQPDILPDILPPDSPPHVVDVVLPPKAQPQVTVKPDIPKPEPQTTPKPETGLLSEVGVCSQIGEKCSSALPELDRCCLHSGVAECLFDIGLVNGGHEIGRCCIKHRKKGCTVDSDCCRVDGVCSSSGKCKKDRSALVAAAVRDVDTKFDNFEMVSDKEGISYMTVSISTVTLLFIVFLLAFPMGCYWYYRKCILKKIKQEVRREVFHGLEVSAHSDNEFEDSEDEYID